MVNYLAQFEIIKSCDCIIIVDTTLPPTPSLGPIWITGDSHGMNSPKDFGGLVLDSENPGIHVRVASSSYYKPKLPFCPHFFHWKQRYS
jgi:hypothetical protein